METKPATAPTQSCDLFTVVDMRKVFDRPPITLAYGADKFLQRVANHAGCGSFRICRDLVRLASQDARTRQGITDGAPVTIGANDFAGAFVSLLNADS